MTEHQHDLFGAAPAARAQAAPPARRLARRENPPTSHAAAEQVPAFASEHRDTILRVMRSHGGRGLTVHEMAAYCRLEAHAIGKRVAELERGGQMRVGTAADGRTALTRASPAGRQARVWLLQSAPEDGEKKQG